ncbi:MAG: type II secretion system F family protein [Candidatus Melainabacteria bacterium]
MLELVSIIALFALVAIALGFSVFFMQRYFNPEPSLIEERLTTLKTTQSTIRTGADLQETVSIERYIKKSDYRNPQTGQALEKIALFRHFKNTVRQTDLQLKSDELAVKYILMPMMILLLLGLVVKNMVMMLGGLVVPVLVNLFVTFKKNQRLQKFTVQFPEALNLITSALKAGHSFQSALTVVSTEMSAPIGVEFSALVSDINLGVPVKEALYRMTETLDESPDIRMFATAVMIQRETGGNLAELLNKLSYTIRERFKLKGQVAALTGQSRLTGYVLGAAPILLFFGLSLFMPGYMDPLLQKPLGNLALGVAVLMQCIGGFIISKIVDIRV